jgi:hypothetical protein
MRPFCFVLPTAICVCDAVIVQLKPCKQQYFVAVTLCSGTVTACALQRLRCSIRVTPITVINQPPTRLLDVVVLKDIYLLSKTPARRATWLHLQSAHSTILGLIPFLPHSLLHSDTAFPFLSFIAVHFDLVRHLSVCFWCHVPRDCWAACRLALLDLPSFLPFHML